MSLGQRSKDLLGAYLAEALNGEYLRDIERDDRQRITALWWDGEILLKLTDPDTNETLQYGKIVVQ